MPIDEQTARLISDQNRRILALETRCTGAENRIAALETRLSSDLREATRQIARCADTAERQLAATNQLGQILSRAEITQSTLAQPKFPWTPT